MTFALSANARDELNARVWCDHAGRALAGPSKWSMMRASTSRSAKARQQRGRSLIGQGPVTGLSRSLMRRMSGRRLIRGYFRRCRLTNRLWTPPSRRRCRAKTIPGTGSSALSLRSSATTRSRSMRTMSMLNTRTISGGVFGSLQRFQFRSLALEDNTIPARLPLEAEPMERIEVRLSMAIPTVFEMEK